MEDEVVSWPSKSRPNSPYADRKPGRAEEGCLPLLYLVILLITGWL